MVKKSGIFNTIFYSFGDYYLFFNFSIWQNIPAIILSRTGPIDISSFSDSPHPQRLLSMHPGILAASSFMALPFFVR